MASTDREYADKEWLNLHEPLPLPVFLMDIGAAILGAAVLAMLVIVTLAIR